jgi:hypothetical protein
VCEKIQDENWIVHTSRPIIIFLEIKGSESMKHRQWRSHAFDKDILMLERSQKHIIEENSIPSDHKASESILNLEV